jgi:hypothetical protein
MDEKLVRRRCGIRSWSAWKPRKETRSQSPLRSRDPVAGYVEVAKSSRGARGSRGIGRGWRGIVKVMKMKKENRLLTVRATNNNMVGDGGDDGDGVMVAMLLLVVVVVVVGSW